MGRINGCSRCSSPLNMALARYLIVRALRKGKIRLQKLPEPMDVHGLSELLVRISQMVVDCPQVHELDIHPLLANGRTFTILDADLILKRYEGGAQERLAIRPYPVEYEEIVTLKTGDEVLLRPILPEDEPLHAEFIHNVTKEDLYKRFLRMLVNLITRHWRILLKLTMTEKWRLWPSGVVLQVLKSLVYLVR